MNVAGLRPYETLDASTDLVGAKAALQVRQTAWSTKTGSVDTKRGDNSAHRAVCMTMFNTIAPPNLYNDSWAHCSRIGSGARSDPSDADSWHPGGINVGMGDGSVKFIKDSINIRTWMAPGTKSNGEVISSDAYSVVSLKKCTIGS